MNRNAGGMIWGVACAWIVMNAFKQESFSVDMPPGGVDILPKDAVAKIQCKAADDSAVATMQIVRTDARFSSVLKVSTKIWAKYRWDVALTIPSREPIKKGDVLLFSFYARGPFSENESGESAADIVFQGLPRVPGVAPMKKMSISAAQEWKQYFAAFESKADCAAGQSEFSAALGFRRQDFELADLRVINYGTTMALSNLPVMKQGYLGMEEAAGWRESALLRIEKLRKTDCLLSMVDAQGAPRANARIQVSLVRHAFEFGGAIRSQCFTENDRLSVEQAERLKQMFIDSGFNLAVLPTDFSWKQYPGGGSSNIPAALAWFDRRGVALRGHTLVWPLWGFMPPEIKDRYERDCDGMQKAICEHIDFFADRFKGRIAQWIVVNESLPIAKSVLGECGSRLMRDWFAHARKADPSARLYINDAGIIAGWDEAKRNEYYDLVEQLIRSGAPLDGIGFQCHFHSLIPPEEILKRLDRFAQLKKDLQITEFDVGCDDFDVQGKYTRDFLIAAFSHPSVGGITSWHGGSQWDGALSGDGSRAMYKKDGSRKPNGDAWAELVTKTWRTDERLLTDARGSAKFRGFYGDYLIVCETGGSVKTNRMTLRREQPAHEVRLVVE